jgi:predicted ribosomally synthesized peptide with SipW-like signal peptide
VDIRTIETKRALLLSGVTILLCFAIVIGMTFALFSDTDSVYNHLQAGTLSVTLKRTRLEKTHYIGGRGLTTEINENVIDFTDNTSLDRNVFDILATDKIVPGCKYVADMQIENHSDATFGYWIAIECSDETKDTSLAKQLRVTVESGDTKAESFIGNSLTVDGDGRGYLGYVAIGEATSFTVTVEFLDSADSDVEIEPNDLAQGQNLRFDLVVYAVQAPAGTELAE